MLSIEQQQPSPGALKSETSSKFVKHDEQSHQFITRKNQQQILHVRVCVDPASSAATFCLGFHGFVSVLQCAACSSRTELALYNMQVKSEIQQAKYIEGSKCSGSSLCSMCK
jgi:hypothetical protein